jgi:6-phosphogluconolactonase (cycloisomerase 2 family)
MRKIGRSKDCVKPFSIMAAVTLSFITAFAANQTVKRYVVTDDDVSQQILNSATFYAVKTSGALNPRSTVSTRGDGIAGGFFGSKRIVAFQRGKTECVYASNAQSGSIVGIAVRTLTIGGQAFGSKKDTGSSNGVGLAMNDQYLYASFTDSNTIGTFQVKPGCKIKFVGDIKVGGLQGGVIDGMAVHGDMLVATYGDGSIESFNVSGGMPVSNGDEQNSTGSNNGNTYPNGVDITEDRRFAIFGDTATSTVVEVSDISSGKLTPTVVYQLGAELSSSNLMLSPDETLLYVSNTQGGTITAAFFDNSTGKLSRGCRSESLKGYVTDWSYLGALAVEETTGTGGVVYVAEYGAPSSIGEIRVKSAGGKCTLREFANSPVMDPSSPGLLSIAAFPPRTF